MVVTTRIPTEMVMGLRTRMMSSSKIAESTTSTVMALVTTRIPTEMVTVLRTRMMLSLRMLLSRAISMAMALVTTRIPTEMVMA